jgi:hypothetical protein
VLQLQCGGLRGLHIAVATPTTGIHAMVQKAQVNDSSLLELPWGEIVSSIAAWQSRRRAPIPKV